MDKPEWIPKYPCGKCVDDKTCNSVAYCPLMAQYDSSLNAQIKLLKYQIEHFSYVPENLINMLKQLEEEKNDNN